CCFLMLVRRSLIALLFPFPTLFRSVYKFIKGGIFWVASQSQTVFENFVFAFARAGHQQKVANGLWVIQSLQVLTGVGFLVAERADRKSTRLNSSHVKISYAVFCLKK